VGDTLAHVWRLFPPFLLGEGLVAISTSSFAINTDDKDESESWLDTFQGGVGEPSPFLWELAGRPIFLLCIQAVVGAVHIPVVNSTPVVFER
jgi:hypothetical protein